MGVRVSGRVPPTKVTIENGDKMKSEMQETVIRIVGGEWDFVRSPKRSQGLLPLLWLDPPRDDNSVNFL